MTDKKTGYGEKEGHALAVRAKASTRKSRSSKVEHLARQPSQLRSQERFELIIQTLEALLKHSNIENISFHDIAAVADISPSSINYLFPTMAALRMEMLKRYLHESSEYHARETASVVEHEKPNSWQELVTTNLDHFRDYLASNRHISEIVLGPFLNREMLIMSIEENAVLADGLCRVLSETFKLQEIPGMRDKLMNSFDCVDTLWRRSYARSGTVEQEALEDSKTLVITYLRNYLPERLFPL